MTPVSVPEPAEERLVSAEGLEALAAELSLFAAPGMVILLKGELGAGKSTFARALIRSLSQAEIDVPSPTFALLQTYTETRIPVAHADLYRLQSATEIAELGLNELTSDHLLIVEWPERLPFTPWSDILTVELSGSGKTRTLHLKGSGHWDKALQRSQEINRFIAGTSWKGSKRIFLEGDASFRRYEVLHNKGSTVILMDMPARPDGPPVKDGKPYSAVAHLAESIEAVAAVNRTLCERGYSAPIIYHCDFDRGLAIMEDLGRDLFAKKTRAGEDMREPLKAASDVLADMASKPWPNSVALPGGRTHVVPPYDRQAQLIEVDLLPSWFWPHLHGIEIAPALRNEFTGLWSELLPQANPDPPVWTLRDYHSPNLLWLPKRKGIKRVGIIDSQDCVLGHPAYDLASLLQDARVNVEFDLADELFEHYCASRGNFDRKSFELAFAILGAQRLTKILGIFARLSKRDGKHAYLAHMPRLWRYLERNLQHPGLGSLKAWFDRNLPLSVRSAK